MARREDHSKVLVRIAEGSPSSLVKCKTKPLPWGEIVKRLADPLVDRMKTKSFLKLPVSEQGRVKGAAGWFVGGPVENGQRNRKNVLERDALTFDIDGCTEAVFLNLIEGFSSLCRYEWALSTTRKHTEDAPRFRLVLPVKESCPVGIYEPVMRILGAELDPTLDGIDDVTFRASQLMYWPTKGPDTEYVFFHNRGELVDPETVLAGYPLDWRNFANLPFSEKRSAARRKADKAENPLEKRGIIGAFCRAYTVPEAIEEFLSDKYTPDDSGSSDPRYTYAEGSVAGGAIVYDNGLFLYSHHDTDPAGHQNLNAFDLVRIHKFEHLDAKLPEDTPMTKRHSFKAMADLANEKREVRGELVAAKLDLAAMFDDVDDLPAEEVEQLYEDTPAKPANRRTWLPRYPGSRPRKKPLKDFRNDLQAYPDGTPKSTVYNVAMILMNDARFVGVLARNAFSGRICARRPIKVKLDIVPRIEVPDPEVGLEWTDYHDDSVRAILEAPTGEGLPGYGMKVSDRDLQSAIRLVASKHQWHPVCDRLADLPEHDGTERAETVFIDYFGCPDTPYHRQACRQFLLGAVARVFAPGHKFDFVPVLSGGEGKRKTTFVNMLAFGKWGGELNVRMDSGKDAVEQMAGRWIVELAELTSMARSEIEAQKAFISRLEDNVRLAYDRRMSSFQRQCVFMGTSNKFEYLKDPENRRFWPIRVTVDNIDTDRLARNLEQIWAEVMGWYRDLIAKHDHRHLPFGLTGEALAEAIRIQSSARIETADDQDVGLISEWIDTPIRLSSLQNGHFHDEDGDPLVVRTKTCSAQVAAECFGDKRTAYRNQRSLQTMALRETFRLPGLREDWIEYEVLTNSQDAKLTVPGYGRQRVFVRRDATRAEMLKGFRIVEEDDQV